MNIQIIEIPAPSAPSNESEREVQLRAAVESGLLEAWLLEPLLAQPLAMPASTLLQLRDVLDLPGIMAVVDAPPPEYDGAGKPLPDNRPGIVITRDSQLCVVRGTKRTHRETGPVHVIGVHVDAWPVGPAYMPRDPLGGLIPAVYPLRYAADAIGAAVVPVICNLDALPELYPAEIGTAALELYEEIRAPTSIDMAEDTPPAAPDRWAKELGAVGLSGHAYDQAVIYGFVPQLLWSEIHNTWHSGIAGIVEAARARVAAAAAARAAATLAMLQRAVRASVRARMFGGKADLTAAESASLEVEYDTALAAALGNKVFPWAPLLRTMAPELEQFFTNNTPGVQDWLRDGDNYPILCPHVWILARRGDTLAVHKLLVEKYGQNEDVGSGIVCRVCGARIGLRDRIDYGDLAALAPDREQADLASKVNQLLRAWLEFGTQPDPISMRKIASGLYGAVQPIVAEARKRLRAVATLAEDEFTMLYDFYSGVAIFAVLVKLLVDNPSRIFAKRVQRRQYVDRPATDTDTAVNKDAAADADAAVNKDATDKDAATDEDTDNDTDEDTSKPAKVTSKPSKPTKPSKAAKPSKATPGKSGGDEEGNHGIIGGDKAPTGAFAKARAWALAAIEQEYKHVLVAMQDLTSEVIANRFDTAYARILAAISSAKLVNQRSADIVLRDPVADAIAASTRVRGAQTGPYWEAITALKSRGTSRRDYSLLLGRLGTHLQVVQYPYEPGKLRAAATNAAATRSAQLGYVYGAGIAANVKALDIKPSAAPHIHRWDIFRRGSEYSSAPHGIFSERYCKICGMAWSSAGTSDGVGSMKLFYDSISFFNFYTSNCPKLPSGHVYGKNDDAPCVCGCTREIIIRRDPEYYNKYAAIYAKLSVRTVSPLAPVTIGKIVGMRATGTAPKAIGARAFATATYQLYATTHTELRAPQYEAVCARLGASYADLWSAHIAGGETADVSPQRISILRGYAQMLLTTISTMQNYANLAYVPAEIEAVAQLMPGKLTIAPYHNSTYWDALRACGGDPARTVAFLTDYIHFTIMSHIGDNRKANVAWVGYVMGRIVAGERAAAKLSDDEMAALSSKPGGRTEEAADKVSVASEEEEDNDEDYSGMDYDGENEKDA